MGDQTKSFPKRIFLLDSSLFLLENFPFIQSIGEYVRWKMMFFM